MSESLLCHNLYARAQHAASQFQSCARFSTCGALLSSFYSDFPLLTYFFAVQAEYISHIARELRDDSRADGIRQMAGLLIKNALDAKVRAVV